MLEYEHRDGTRKTKEIDLLQLTPEYVVFAVHRVSRAGRVVHLFFSFRFFNHPPRLTRRRVRPRVHGMVSLPCPSWHHGM